MAYSGMLYWLDISRFYFYEPLLFQIFFLWKFIKNQVFPYLLSLLQSTAMQITISIYKYIYLFPKLYNIKSVFFSSKKYKLRFFIFKFDLNVKHRLYFFLMKNMVYRKNFIAKVVLNFWFYTIFETPLCSCVSYSKFQILIFGEWNIFVKCVSQLHPQVIMTIIDRILNNKVTKSDHKIYFEKFYVNVLWTPKVIYFTLSKYCHGCFNKYFEVFSATAFYHASKQLPFQCSLLCSYVSVNFSML